MTSLEPSAIRQRISERHRCKQCGDIREGRWVTLGWWCRLCEAATLNRLERKVNAHLQEFQHPTHPGAEGRP